jgi:hypothetical protein
MVTITLGNKKKSYKSIRLAANETGIPYMTLYMRIRKDTGGLGWNVAKAVKKPVRKYERQTVAVLDRKAMANN